jgi:AcrR family transcriptional regulator
MPYPAKTTSEEILNVARVLLEQTSGEALSMRNLAKRLNMKAPSLYRYFASKETLEVALVGLGAKELQVRLEEAAQTPTLKQAFLAIARAYLLFAKHNPALYSLMMTKAGPASPDAGAGKDLWNFVLSLMSQVTKKPDDTPAAVAFWSFLHGFSVLESSGMFGASGPKGGLEVGLEAFLKGLPKSR